MRHPIQSGPVEMRHSQLEPRAFTAHAAGYYLGTVAPAPEGGLVVTTPAGVRTHVTSQREAVHQLVFGTH